MTASGLQGRCCYVGIFWAVLLFFLGGIGSGPPAHAKFAPLICCILVLCNSAFWGRGARWRLVRGP